jgi:hypothetical protein
MLRVAARRALGRRHAIRQMATQPHREQNSTVPMAEFSHIGSHNEVFEFSIREPDAFWGTVREMRMREG